MMTERYVDVYRDKTNAKLSIGIRDDGATTTCFMQDLSRWKGPVERYTWMPNDSMLGQGIKEDCGEFLGRVPYPDD